MGHSDLLSNGTSYKQYSLHFGAKICTGVLSADTVCFEKQIVLQKQSSRKTVSFDERKKFKDKHPRVFFKSIRGYFVCCLSNIFRNTRDLLNIGTHNSDIPSFSHSRPQRPRSFWSAHQEFCPLGRSKFLNMRRVMNEGSGNESVDGQNSVISKWLLPGFSFSRSAGQG